jgi:ADP-heptose:LPS heptosyltransferase
MYRIVDRGRYAIYRSWSASGLAAQPSRIVVLKLDHVGDFWIAAGPLRTLRVSFPRAHITLVVARWNVDAAHRLRVADEVVAYDFFARNPRHDERGAVQAIAEVLPGPFDLAIDLRVPIETRALLQALPATRKAAIADRHLMPWVDIAVPRMPLKVRWSAAYRIAALLRLPANARPLFDPTFGARRDNLQHVEDMLAFLVAKVVAAFPPGPTISGARSVPRDAPVVVAPISNSALRDWLPERYGQVVAGLARRDMPVSLVGRPESESAIDAIIRTAASTGVNSSRITVERDLADEAFGNYLARARLVISNNSGAGHVAARLGVPTLGIYTASHLPEMWGFRGALVSILAARMACSGCGLDRPRHCPWGVRCKYAIEPGDVLAEAEALLAFRPDLPGPQPAAMAISA